MFLKGLPSNKNFKGRRLSNGDKNQSPSKKEIPSASDKPSYFRHILLLGEQKPMNYLAASLRVMRHDLPYLKY